MSPRLLSLLFALACTPEDPTDPVGEGTEIGEEGGGAGDCIEERVALAGPEAVPPGFEHSLAELTERWQGTFEADDATLRVDADLAAAVYVARTPYEHAPWTECRDWVEVPAGVGFTHEDLELETPAGILEIEVFGYAFLSADVRVYDAETGANGISDDGVEAIPDDPGTLSAAAGPETLNPSGMSTIGVHVHASGDPDGWFASVLWRRTDLDSGRWWDEDIWVGPIPAD